MSGADAPVLGVAFDLDGTLIDSRTDIVRSTNHALAQHGFATLPDEEIASYVGDGSTLLLARAARLDPDDARLRSLLADFLDYYTAHAIDHTRLMPDTTRVLDALADLPLALVTNKPRRATDATLRGLDLERRFRVVVAGDDLADKKPAPGPLLLAADKLGLPPATLVMVGDGAQDIECGRAAGARTVGVEGGIQARERLAAAHPDALVALAALPDVIRAWRFRAGPAS